MSRLGKTVRAALLSLTLMTGLAGSVAAQTSYPGNSTSGTTTNTTTDRTGDRSFNWGWLGLLGLVGLPGLINRNGHSTYRGDMGGTTPRH